MEDKRAVQAALLLTFVHAFCSFVYFLDEVNMVEYN